MVASDDNDELKVESREIEKEKEGCSLDDRRRVEKASSRHQAALGIRLCSLDNDTTKQAAA